MPSLAIYDSNCSPMEESDQDETEPKKLCKEQNTSTPSPMNSGSTRPIKALRFDAEDETRMAVEPMQSSPQPGIKSSSSGILQYLKEKTSPALKKKRIPVVQITDINSPKSSSSSDAAFTPKKARMDTTAASGEDSAKKATPNSQKFVCNVDNCNKSFSVKRSLWSHQKKKHSGNNSGETA